MRYLATIKWLDNGNIQDDMIFKIGDIEDDDDDIFFYLYDENEIEQLKKEGEHEWVILSIEKQLTQLDILKEELERYKKGFEIMICYFDSISDEEQPKVNKKLAILNL